MVAAKAADGCYCSASAILAVQAKLFPTAVESDDPAIVAHVHNFDFEAR